MNPMYPDLADACAKLERRSPDKYRFDLEADVAWDKIGEPGEYCSAKLLTALGINAGELRRNRPAYDLFQWAYALTVCEQFIVLEDIIVRFLAQQGEHLGQTKSAEWLGEEEEKHIAMFRRYADYLRTVEPTPGAAAQLDALFADSAASLATALDRADYPSDATYHYVFWLKVLFFEEYTIYLDERLQAESRFVQPAWLSAHAAHRREEEQHVVTDMAYVQSLELSAAERTQFAKLFVMDFEANSDVFLSIDAPFKLVQALFPEAAAQVTRSGLDNSDVFEAVMSSRTFRRTRAAAPYLQARADHRAAEAEATQPRSVSAPKRKVGVPRQVAAWRDSLRDTGNKISARLGQMLEKPAIERYQLKKQPAASHVELQAESLRADASAASSRTAEQVRDIWAEVLEIPANVIDPDANFLTIGGDSVRAVAIHGVIEERYGRFLDFEILHTCRTVNEFATYLDRHIGPLPERADADVTHEGVREQRSPPDRVVPVSSADAVRPKDVAVIAMAGRFPNAPDLDAFWHQLETGQAAFRRVPGSRWNVDDYYDERPGTPGKVACKVGAFIDDVDLFDPEAFGLTEAHALDTDPQQRLFLELAGDVLDQAGKFSDNIGVFASTGWNTYLPRYAPERIGRLTAVGNLHNMVAARVCQVLGLHGPAFTVDAACASSLLAVHLACRSVRNGDCDAAIAGGVELLFNPQTYLSFGQARVLSDQAECMPFSVRASGFLLGEGGGAVLLKPLADAVAAGDPIIAVIKGSAVNNDGGGYSAMSPSPEGQMDVLRRAYRDADVDTGTVSYVEAHGTATPVGDAVELRALSQVFGPGDGDQRCGIGSVKSNIGHLFSAAGIASLLKVLLSFKHGKLAPIANFDEPHPRHHFERTRFYPLAEAQPWSASDSPRRAGVTALGVGGSNCHMVLEDAPARHTASSSSRDAELLQLCGPDDQALAAVASHFDDYLAANPHTDLAEFCAAANARAYRFDTRCGLVASSVDELRKQLVRLPRATSARIRPKLMFVFSAPGSQHMAMGRHLYDSERVFREAFNDCDALVRGRLPRSLAEMLYEDPRSDSSEIDQIATTQPLMFAFSYAVCTWLGHLGIRPDGVLGHSAGEYAAACAAGVFDLATGLELVARRGQLMADCEPGAMYAVLGDAQRIQPLIDSRSDELSIAAINNPNQVVLSGRTTAIRSLAEVLERDGIKGRELAISCAAHSPLMQPARTKFADAFAGRTMTAPQLPFYSTVTGRKVTATDVTEASYWLEHMTATVKFETAVRAAAKDGYNVFVEVGPSSGLSHSIQLTFPERDSHVVPVPTNSRSEAGWAPTLRGLAAMYEAGVGWDWAKLRAGAAPIQLPPYPYYRRRFWAIDDVDIARAGASSQPEAPPVPTERSLSGTEERSLHDHVIWDRPIAPGAFLMEQCLTGLRRNGHEGAGLSRILISRSLDVDAFRGPTRLRFADERVLLESSADDGRTWTEHIHGHIAAPEDAPPPALDMAALRTRCAESIPIDTMYGIFENDSFRLGPSVKTAVEVQRGTDEVLARLESPADVQPSTRFAGLVDGAFHSLAALTVGVSAGSFAFLSFSVERVDLYDALPPVCFAHVKLLGKFDVDSGSLRCDVNIVDADGRVLLRLQHVGLRRASPPKAAEVAEPAIAEQPTVSEPHDLDAYAVAWRPTPLIEDAGGDVASRYIILTRAGVLSPTMMSLRRRLEDVGSMVQISRLPQDISTLPGQLARLRPADSAIICVEPELDQLRALVQALMRRQRPSCRELTVLGSSRMNAAFMQSVSQEGVGWPCRAILVDVQAPAIDPVVLANSLDLELRTPPDQFTVSYESGYRRVPVLAAIDAGQAAVVGNGFVWITGALGGIGRALARDLVSRGAKKLLLSGRRDEAPADFVSDIEGAGGELLYARADVTSADDLQRALTEATTRWGQLDSVFHLAGVVADKLVWNQTREDAAALLAPKVQGTRALLNCVRDTRVKRIALFSSYVTQFGRAGQSDYAAANAFLDQAAWDYPELPVVSFNWFPWSVGMAGSAAYQAAARSQGLIPLHPASAFTAMFNVIDTGHRQIVMAALQPERRSSIAEQFQTVSWQRPDVAARPAASRTVQSGNGAGESPGDVGEFLRAELAALLKVGPESVDVHQPFPAMGLESLTAVNLIRKIEDRYDLALYPTLLFEITTAAELTRYLDDRLAETNG